MRSTSAVALVLLLAPSSAYARRKSFPQAHEVRADLDIGVGNQANASFVDAIYLWTPQPLESEDEVVPSVRRFVHHPTEIFFHAHRDGSTIDTRTSAQAGATVYLLDGRLYAKGAGGIEYDDVRYETPEAGYLTAPYRVEIGARPHPLIQVGAYYAGRPILAGYGSGEPGFSTEREGSEWEAGGTFAFATADDRLTASFSGGYHRADWTFRFFCPGDTDVSGLRGTFDLSYQFSPTFSWLLRGNGSQETWDNQRNSACLSFEEISPTKTKPTSFAADTGMLYWYEKRFAFRFTIGGAYDGERPLLQGEARGYLRFGFGMISRF